jgi:hypothetical protein
MASFDVDSARLIIKRILNPPFISLMASCDVDGARRVIKRIVNPRFFS